MPQPSKTRETVVWPTKRRSHQHSSSAGSLIARPKGHPAIEQEQVIGRLVDLHAERAALSVACGVRRDEEHRQAGGRRRLQPRRHLARVQCIDPPVVLPGGKEDRRVLHAVAHATVRRVGVQRAELLRVYSRCRTRDVDSPFGSSSKRSCPISPPAHDGADARTMRSSRDNARPPFIRPGRRRLGRVLASQQLRCRVKSSNTCFRGDCHAGALLAYRRASMLATVHPPRRTTRARQRGTPAFAIVAP